MASLAERPTGAAPQSSTAPMLSTDRLAASGSEAPPAASGHGEFVAGRGLPGLGEPLRCPAPGSGAP